MDQLWKYTGIITWILIALFLLLRLIFGKRWYLKAGVSAVLGTGLTRSMQKLFRELPNKVQRDTLAEVGAKVINRFVRVGFVGLLLAIIPIWLLVNQNKILEVQTGILNQQSDKIDIQNSLMESQRRNSLVLLMSNIMEQINEEIQKQKDDPNHVDSLGYSLSEPLIGRIAALSQGFLPYRMYQEDTLSTKEYSPERGQLLLALVNSKLDNKTLSRIYSRTTFEAAYLDGASLYGVTLQRAYLRGASLRGASLSKANLTRAILESANLSSANLSFAKLSNANLGSANLSYANLEETYFSSANLRGAIFHSANLRKTNLHAANLRFTDFRKANLFGTILTNSDLYAANLETAILFDPYKKTLSDSDLHKYDKILNVSKESIYANLDGANLKRVNLKYTVVKKEQLENVSSLHLCENLKPETEQQLRKEIPCLFEQDCITRELKKRAIDLQRYRDSITQKSPFSPIN